MKEQEIATTADDALVFNGFVKLMRSELLQPLWARGDGAWKLISIVAVRAWRGPGNSPSGCGPGEAFVGDWKECGMTEKTYRVAKKQLEEMKMCSFRATNKGCIAKLLNSRIWDINADLSVTDRTTKGEQGASQGRPKGEQGASQGRAEGEHGANEGRLTRIEEVKNSELEAVKNSKKEEVNNSAVGAGDGVAPSAGNTEVANTQEAEADPRSAEEIPGSCEPLTPTQKAVMLSKELPHYLKAVCEYQTLPVFTTQTLNDAREYFERNTHLEYWDVAHAVARAVKLSRENPAPEDGVDPYYMSRRFAGRPNKLFSTTAEGDLYLARLMLEVKYDAENGESAQGAQDLFDAELARIVTKRKAAKAAKAAQEAAQAAAK